MSMMTGAAGDGYVCAGGGTTRTGGRLMAAAPNTIRDLVAIVLKSTFDYDLRGQLTEWRKTDVPLTYDQIAELLNVDLYAAAGHAGLPLGWTVDRYEVGRWCRSWGIDQPKKRNRGKA